MSTDFQQHYAMLSDDELLRIAADRRHLTDEARMALYAAMGSRGLTSLQVVSHHREVRRAELDELRRGSKRKKNRYFNTNELPLRWLLPIIVVAPATSMILNYRFHVAEEWCEAVLSTLMGTAFAVLAVRPWVRRQAGFWIALAVSAAVQFYVAHLLALRILLLRGKGYFYLSIASGWALGFLVFRLILLMRAVPESEMRDM